MKVTINENNENIGKPYYVYFLDTVPLASISDSSETTATYHYLRYKLDSDNYKKTFPNLIAQNYYKLDDLHLDTIDSYIGMYLANDIDSITSVILSNQLKTLTTDITYNYMYITDEQADDYTKILDYWLYSVDFSDVTNVFISYIIEFIETSREAEDITANNVTVYFHEYDETSHLTDLIYFPSDKNYSSIMSRALGNFITNKFYHDDTIIRLGSYTGNIIDLGATAQMTYTTYKEIRDAYSSTIETEENQDWYDRLEKYYRFKNSCDELIYFNCPKHPEQNIIED